MIPIIIRGGEVRRAVVVFIAFVLYNKIISSSENWSIGLVIRNCLFEVGECHLLFEIKREKETFSLVVNQKSVVG
jgi:hypothetical protein